MSETTPQVTVIGGGLAGCEAPGSWPSAASTSSSRDEAAQAHAGPPDRHAGRAGLLQLPAQRQPGERRGPAAGGAAARSARSILRSRRRPRVPAGDALAVDRDSFAAGDRARSKPPPHPRRTREVDRAARDAPCRCSPPGRSPPTRWPRRSAARAGRAALLLRRHRAHRAAPNDRHGARLPRRRATTRAGDGLPELPVRRGASTRASSTRSGGREGDAARLRGAAVLRGLPAHRGHGRARRADALASGR